MTKETTMTLEFVTDLEAHHDGQVRALYKRGDEYLMVSTVNLSTTRLSADQRAIVNVAGLLAGAATGGEETMAFPCDECGEPTSWTEVAAAHGACSRETVLDNLRSVAA